MGIYEKVKALCDEQGISIHRLEKLAGLGNGTIGRWDKSSPTVLNLKAVADELGVDVTELLSSSEGGNK